MFGAIAGSIAGSLASKAADSLFGGSDDEGGGGGGSRFIPYTLSSGFGRAQTGINENTGEMSFSVGLRDDLQELGDTGYAGAGTLSPLALAQYQRDVPMFSYDPQLDQRTEDYFNTQMDLLRPQMVQQAQMAGERMFGGGTIGRRLASDALGAGTGLGLLNPDAYALNLAQARATQEAYSQAREKAQREMQQDYDIRSGVYGLNRQAQQQYLANLDAGLKSMLGLGTTMSDLEKSLFSMGLSGSQTVSGAGQNAPSTPEESMMSKLMGGMLPNAIGGISKGVGDWVNSKWGSSGSKGYLGGNIRTQDYGYAPYPNS